LYLQVKEWQDAWDEKENKDSEKQGLDQHGTTIFGTFLSTSVF